MTPVPTEIAAVFDAAPEAVRARLYGLRAMAFAAAEATGTLPLEESLKWGQPAFRPKAPRTGTTLRLGWRAEACTLFVPCQTDLLDQYRARFAGLFAFDGDRAVHVPVAPGRDEAALQQMMAMALTYHRDKRGRA